MSAYSGRLADETGALYDFSVELAPVVIPPTSTTTALTSSASEIEEGAAVTLTATVTPAAPGTVTFRDDETVIATVGATSGTATAPGVILALGARALTATFTPTDAAAYSTSSGATSVTVSAPAVLTASATLNGTSAVLSWSYNGTNPDQWTISLDSTPRATTPGLSRGMSVDNLTPGAHTLTVAGAGKSANATVSVPQPTYPVPAAGQAVTIGTATRAVDGINVARDVNKLVAYTRTGSQTVTTTNQYGVEATIAFGKVVSVVNRIAGNVTAGTPIPAEGYVLSGHGLGVDYAGQWLLDNATVGTSVAVGTAPDPQPQPSGDALPAKIVGAYVNMYQGPAVAELPDYNVIFAAFALGAGGQNMHFIAPAKESDASFRAGVLADQARGAKWILSIGGGVPVAEQTFIRSDAEATAVFNKLVPIIDSYGFNGLDYDLENGPAGFTQGGLLALSRKLRTKYGAGFAITMTPRPYENFYFTIAAAHHAEGLLDALQMQFYDEMKTRDDAFLASWIPSRLDAAKNAGVPYNKMVVGCICWSAYSYGWNTPAVYGAIIRQMKTTRGIRGAMVWDTAQESKEGYPFYQMAKTL